MIGKIVGKYRIAAKLGQGGMGDVYVAEHTVMGKRAVVKVLRPYLSRHEEAVGRFFNEAMASARCDHPAIIDIYDVGFTPDGLAYLVMEHLEGESLAALIERSAPLRAATACSIAWEIATALDAAHRVGVIHRDLKPDNVFLVPDPAARRGVRVKIIDFGVAKVGAGSSEPPPVVTGAGAFFGTPAYMSPEQCRGAGNVDGRADVYSLGCILYEMVCGRPPFVSEVVAELIMDQLTEDPPPASTLVPVSFELESIIEDALQKSPFDRIASMRAFAAHLDVLECGPFSASELVDANATTQPFSLVETLLGLGTETRDTLVD